MQYTVGIDYGTLSGRAVLVDVKTGHTVATAVYEYPHGVMDAPPLPQGWALQHPRDYVETLEQTVPALLTQSGVSPEEIVGIGVDFTASTALPVDEKGVPLCFYEEYGKEPHAYVKMWKHHGAQNQADRITALAMQRQEPWLPRFGSKISSEMSLPKLMQLWPTGWKPGTGSSGSLPESPDGTPAPQATKPSGMKSAPSPPKHSWKPFIRG